MSESKNKNSFKFKRPLVKLSGEMLGGADGFGFNRQSLELFANEIKTLVENDIIPGIVIGGGNFFRGARSNLPALRRHRGDVIGMLSTVMNGICFAEHLEDIGISTRVFSAVPIGQFAMPYHIDEARKLIELKTVCIYSGGTGNPYFSTDSGAALRAIETGCDVLLKGTKVDGVYDSDPMKNPNARKFDKITYSKVIELGLKVMDLVAITLCRDNRMPLLVVSMQQPGTLLRACKGDNVGTNVIEKEK